MKNKDTRAKRNKKKPSKKRNTTRPLVNSASEVLPSSCLNERLTDNVKVFGGLKFCAPFQFEKQTGNREKNTHNSKLKKKTNKQQNSTCSKTFEACFTSYLRAHHNGLRMDRLHNHSSSSLILRKQSLLRPDQG